MLKQFEIYLIKYIQDDGKTYPRACMFYKNIKGTIVFMKITKSEDDRRKSIPINRWEEAGLLRFSYLQLNRLQNPMPFDIGRRIGILHEEDIQGFKDKLPDLNDEIEGMILRGEFSI